jgi:thioredoxin reductase
MTESSPTHRYVIIGAGPAGLQLSYYLQRAGADYVALEREAAPGHFFRRYPRHRRLISINKVNVRETDPEIRLRWDWNSLLNDSPDLLFPKFSREYFPHADDMTRYLEEFQRQWNLNVRYGVRVTGIERTPDGFFVHAPDAVFRAECVIVATGWGKPYVPPIPGIEHAVGYEDMRLDPEFFEGQRVLIIGKGNSAFETATPLIGHASMVHLASRRPLRLAWNTKHPGDVRGHYSSILDSYQFKTLHSVLDCTIDRIRPAGDHFEALITYTHADGERAVLEYESVLRCTGFRMDTALFGETCRPEMARDGRFPALGPDWQAAGADGLYFAGTIAQARDFRHASSPFIDGFRYNLRALAAILRERYEGIPLPCDTAPADPERLTGLVLDRVNWSSALWTQFEYFCDVLLIDDRGGRVTHYRDLPEDFVLSRFSGVPHYYTVTLRWGRVEYPDVFAIDRHPEPGRAEESAFIHPVIRRYHGQELISEQHLLEDLLAEWRRPDRHVEPLRAYFARSLASSAP